MQNVTKMTETVPVTRIVTEAQKERPEFETQYLHLIGEALTAFNKAAILRAKGLQLTATLDLTPRQTTTEGNNWGSSRVDKWGEISINLEKTGLTPVTLLSYRATTWDGSPSLTGERAFEVGDREFKPLDPKSFDIFLDRLTQNAQLALAKKFDFPPKDTQRLTEQFKAINENIKTDRRHNLALANICMTLRLEYPGMDLKQIVRGPLSRYIRQATFKVA
jgi:hypothetical protein